MPAQPYLPFEAFDFNIQTRVYEALLTDISKFHHVTDVMSLFSEHEDGKTYGFFIADEQYGDETFYKMNLSKVIRTDTGTIESWYYILDPKEANGGFDIRVMIYKV